MDKLDLILQKMETLENGMTQANTRLETLEGGLAQANARLGTLESGMEQANARLGTLESGLALANEKLERTREELGEARRTLEDKIEWIKLDLENRINPAISIIAENHVESTKKLGKILDIKEKVDLNTIRISMLETSVRTLKDEMKIASFARM